MTTYTHTLTVKFKTAEDWDTLQTEFIKQRFWLLVNDIFRDQTDWNPVSDQANLTIVRKFVSAESAQHWVEILNGMLNSANVTLAEATIAPI